jgi:hypothetical protein
MVPLPLITVVNVAPATLLVIVKRLPVEPEQTVAGPSMSQSGAGTIVTVFWQVEVHPAAVTVVVRVNVPGAPGFTVIADPASDPTIVALPEITVENVEPGTEVPIVNWRSPASLHRESGPLIVQLGTGLTSTVFVHSAEQPAEVMVVVSVKDPAAPASTVTDDPVEEPTIDPFPAMVVE